MTTYPIEIRRCRHIRTNGTQCGSPALKSKELCYYHDQNRPRAADLYIDGERYSDWSVVIPVLEDAHSIQTVIQQVVQMMLARRIDRKDAGVLLYALQIASGNLKAMQAEKAKPTQMVVEPEKAAETPMGMTPWSANGEGHDPEEAEGEETEEEDSPADRPSAEECFAAMIAEERSAMRDGLKERKVINEGELQDYICGRGLDPLLPAMKQLREKWERIGQL